jgi:hypothetical protein
MVNRQLLLIFATETLEIPMLVLVAAVVAAVEVGILIIHHPLKNHRLNHRPSRQRNPLHHQADLVDPVDLVDQADLVLGALLRMTANGILCLALSLPAHPVHSPKALLKLLWEFLEYYAVVKHPPLVRGAVIWS